MGNSSSEYEAVCHNENQGDSEEKKLEATIQSLEEELVRTKTELKREKSKNARLGQKVDSLFGQLRRYERQEKKRKLSENIVGEEVERRKRLKIGRRNQKRNEREVKLF